MPHLRIYLLGAPRIEIDQVTIETSRRKATALLAYLAVTNKPHNRDTLATLLWPEYDQVNARAALRGVLNAIKSALGERWLQAGREIIALQPDKFCWVDVSEFRRFMAERQAHSHEDGLLCSRCLKLLSNAVELYSGEFMAGFTLPDSPSFDEWQSSQTDKLSQELTVALEQLVKTFAVQHNFKSAIKYAQQWLVVDTFHEPAHRQLMQLYAWSGQRAAALRQYESCQKALDEIGVDPESATVILYETIRDGTLPLPEMAHTEPSALAKYLKPTPSPRLHHLPVKLTPFLARETELVQIAELLADEKCRLLTLIGPGGIGKTRIAVEAAERQTGNFAYGVFYSDLIVVNDSGLLLQSIANTLLFKLNGAEDLKTQLFRFLREKEILLILDNFEHLLDEALLISELLVAAPHLKVIATSREPLTLQEEWLLKIEGLSFPEPGTEISLEHYGALQLFTQSARRSQPSFSLTQEQSAVVQICQLLNGMPLGIELAAGNLYTMSCQQVAEGIGHNIGLLATSIRNVPERHRSIQAVFEQSWHLLSERHRQILMKLSVFRGGLTVQAAHEIAEATEDDLQLLVHKSLLNVETTGRYSLHELLRQFAAEKLIRSGTQGPIYRLHLDFFCSLAEMAETRLQRADQLDWLQRLDQEQGNLRTALDVAVEGQQSNLALRLVGALWRYWAVRVPFNEGRHSVMRALTVPGNPSLFRARALLGIGTLARLQGDYTTAQSYYTEALGMFRALNDQQGIANVFTHQGAMAYKQGNFQQGKALLEEGLGVFRSLDDQQGIAFALHNLAALLGEQGGDYETPVRLYTEVLGIREILGDKLGIANVGLNLGIIAHDIGDYVNAREHYQSSLVLYTELGDQRMMGSVLTNLADIANREKDYETAQALLERCLAIRDELGDQRGRAFTLIALADGILAKGDAEGSALLLKESLTIFHEIGEKRNLVYILQGLGSAAKMAGDELNAARLFGASDGIRSTLAMTVPPSDQLAFDKDINAVRAALGPDIFQQAFAEGNRMTLDEAVAFALS